MSIFTAFRAFFTALGNSEKAQRISDILAGKPSGPVIAWHEAIPPDSAVQEEQEEPVPSKLSCPQARHEALTLLAAFQREARFLDFLQEDLSEYDDAQVGAAARNVHRMCRDVVNRMFAPAALFATVEGEKISLPEKINPAIYNLTGNVSSTAIPSHGVLIHHGWRVTKCDVPQWSGTEEEAEILAPAEVEV
ncbi:MAG: DUF2760 domain-containing protein [Planctomycetia bacterium]|nr:DUF2760 domain-containing protein [Planctomycetia bacterium]